MQIEIKKIFWALTLATTVACSSTSTDTNPLLNVTQAQKQAVIENYADIVLANYEDSLDLALELQVEIETFLASPSAGQLEICKEKWTEARKVYSQTEAFRFYNGPIDDEDGPEGALNAWPLDEAYIDYVEGDVDSGIINNTMDHPELTQEYILSLNEKDGEANISTGYHAIEFLLWGQDLSFDSAGTRPYTDYVTDGTGTALNQDRRIAYLRFVTQQLVDDLQSLVDDWSVGVSGNYRETFLATNEDLALGLIFKGIGSLTGGELATERMEVPLQAADLGLEEEEHSCFSDTTHFDFYYNQLGIQNVYLGTYVRSDGTTTVSGSSLSSLVALVNADLDTALTLKLNENLGIISDIPTPFDAALQSTEGRAAIEEAIFNLYNNIDDENQTTLLSEAALNLGLTVNFE